MNEWRNPYDRKYIIIKYENCDDKERVIDKPIMISMIHSREIEQLYEQTHMILRQSGKLTEHNGEIIEEE